MENCVVRTYKNGYANTTAFLTDKLNQGWIVKFVTPMIHNGDTECV